MHGAGIASEARSGPESSEASEGNQTQARSWVQPLRAGSPPAHAEND